MSRNQQFEESISKTSRSSLKFSTYLQGGVLSSNQGDYLTVLQFKHCMVFVDTIISAVQSPHVRWCREFNSLRNRWAKRCTHNARSLTTHLQRVFLYQTPLEIPSEILQLKRYIVIGTTIVSALEFATQDAVQGQIWIKYTRFNISKGVDHHREKRTESCRISGPS